MLWANALAKTKVVALPEILPLVILLAVQPPVWRWLSENKGRKEGRRGEGATKGQGGETVL